VDRGAEADRARLEAILESSSSIIVALDSRYRLTDLNGAARRILGLTESNQIVLDSWVMQCAVYFLGLLLVCLICHCELAALKPGPKHLTSYFLSMSLGGALGGALGGGVTVGPTDGSGVRSGGPGSTEGAGVGSGGTVPRLPLGEQATVAVATTRAASAVRIG